MPKDDDKTIVDKNGKEAEGEAQAETPKSSGGLKKIIMFGGVGVAAIVLGIVVSVFVIKPMMADRGGSDDGGGETTQVSASDAKKPAADKHQKSKKAKGEPKESHVYLMKDIVINPAGTGGTRFLSVSFGFELESQEMMRMFEGREPIIRDALITILSSKSVSQLTDFKQKEIIRYQIKKRVGQIMDTEELTGVYYTDFVLQ